MRIENNILIAECTAYDFKVALERKKVRDWLKSISAFANSYGGSLYFGVQNNGELVGLTDIQSDADFISEKIKSHLDAVPRFQMIPHQLEDGRKFLEVSVDDDKKPSFRSSHSMFYTIVPNVNYGVSENAFEKFVNARRIRDNEKYPVNDEKYPVNNEKYPVNNKKYPVKPLNKTAQRIIDAMMDDPTITRATLSDKVGVGPDAVKKHIADLRKRGIITREGSDKKGLWIVLIKK